MKGSADSSTKAARPPRSPGTCAPPLPERFVLVGPSPRLDPRTHAYRRDIADIVLADVLFAPHYVRAERCACVAAATMVRRDPSPDGTAVTQLVRGEGFAVLDRAAGWAWGRCGHDDYVGYVPMDALGPEVATSHVVDAPLALVFAEASIKTGKAATLPIGARLAGEPIGDFLRTDDGFVHNRHVRPLSRHADDPVAIAERLVGQPYLWGGRGAGGIDCSGLVQVAFGLAGIAAPRDSDQQRAALGRLMDDGEPLRRGDIVFFPGHVGLMVDGERLIHANAHWMAVTIEPLADVVGRLRPLHDTPICARRRIGA